MQAITVRFVNCIAWRSQAAGAALRQTTKTSSIMENIPIHWLSEGEKG